MASSLSVSFSKKLSASSAVRRVTASPSVSARYALSYELKADRKVSEFRKVLRSDSSQETASCL